MSLNTRFRSASDAAAGAMGEDVDYAEEGRKLLARVNLGEEDGFGATRYAPVSKMFKHPGGGTLYIGGHSVARDKDQLQKLGISRIVFCQDEDGRCHFEGEDWVQYHRFSIGKWRTAVGTSPSADRTVAYFEPHLRWIESELALGNSCLVHCLAGAHRAGTAGIASLMWLLNIPSDEAIPMAQRLRPAIEPIGGYPLLLARLSEGLASRRTQP